MGNAKHFIGIDSCLNTDGFYEICVYSKLKELNPAERLEMFRKFKRKSIELIETMGENIIFEILKDNGIHLDKSNQKDYEMALKRLKTKCGKSIKIIPCKNKDKNSKVLCTSEQGHDICLSNDDTVYIVEKIGLCQ